MLVASVDVRFQGKAGEVGAVSRKRVSALGRPAPASSARSHHITWFVIPGSALGGQNQLHRPQLLQGIFGAANRLNVCIGFGNSGAEIDVDGFDQGLAFVLALHKVAYHAAL